MTLAAHITFYYNNDRLQYLQKVVDALSQLSADVSLFIYTNQEFEIVPAKKCLITFYHYPYNKYGFLNYAYKGWSDRFIPRSIANPFLLAWENRKMIETLAESFDVQMYLEDDIYFTEENFQYWLKNKDLLTRLNYNPGFVRIEKIIMKSVSLLILSGAGNPKR